MKHAFLTLALLSSFAMSASAKNIPEGCLSADQNWKDNPGMVCPRDIGGAASKSSGRRTPPTAPVIPEAPITPLPVDPPVATN